MEPVICAIDFSAIFYGAYHASADQPLPELAANVLKQVRFIRSKVDEFNGPDVKVNYIVCLDSRKNWRKEVSPDYKANREKRGSEFYEQMERSVDELKRDGFITLSCEGFEADDVIGSIGALTKGKYFIVSPDKDLLQLVGPDVLQIRSHDMFLPDGHTLKTWTPEMVLDYLGVLPQRVPDYLAIVGDASDNIIGIERVGGKGASAFIAAYRGVEEFCESLENSRFKGVAEHFPGSFIDWGDSLTRWKKPLDAFFSLPNAIDHLRLNLKLTKVRTDAPIPPDFMTKKEEQMPEEKPVEELNGQWETEQPAKEESYASAQQEPQTTQAMVKVNPLSEFSSELQPTGMSGAYWLARRAIASRLYATKFGTEDKALMVILRGRDFGLSPAASLELLQVVEGRVCPPAQLLVGMAKRNPDCEYFRVREITATSATVETKRKGTPEAELFTYTLEMAQAAGLVKPKSAWEKHPSAMCVKMASSWLVRWVYPDSTTGAYSYEEMEAA